MAQRPLLKGDQWAVLLNAPADGGPLIQHYTLGEAELELVRAKAADHNQLGLAVQLCLMRHLSRPWLHDETLPPALIAFVAQQLDLRPEVMTDYYRRDTTRREHAVEVQRYLGLRAADRSDRRAALAAGISTAAATDKGRQIAEAMIAAFRERHALLPAADSLDRTGRAARAIARRRMERTLLDDLDAGQLAALDTLLEVDPEIRLTRFACRNQNPRRSG